MRYARRLAEGQGLTWTAGERVEGYTDLLWVLLIALAKLLGRDPIASARALDFFGALSAIVLVCLDPKPLRLVLARVFSGGLMLASLAPLAVWAIGGLEHGFMAGVIVAALLSLSRALACEAKRRELLVAGALLGALALLRADGIVLVTAAGLGALVAKGRPRRPALLNIALTFSVPFGLLVLQHAFRLAYYHELVPNTALVKVSFSHARLLVGWEHVVNGYRPVWPLVVLAAAALLTGASRLRKERWLPALSMTLVWSAYLACVGGDIFPGWRQLLLGLVPIAVLLAEGTQAASERWSRGEAVAAAVVLPALLHTWKRQSADPENQRAVTERWELDGYAVGGALRDAFGEQRPLLAVDAAGALPYWSELPSLDMLGLNDAYLPRHPPERFGSGGIGHELGDGRYVWQRRPDIIAFNNAAGAREPRFLSGRQLLSMPEFRRSYQLLRVQGARGNRAVGELWFRREGGKLGLTRGERRIEIPGYFFAGAGAVASPGRDGKLVVSARLAAPAVLPSLEIPAGKWRLIVEPPSAELAVAFRCNGVSASATGVAAPPSLEVATAAPVDVVVGTSGPGVVTLESASLVAAETATHRCAPASDGWIDVELGALSQLHGEGSPWDGPASVVFRSPGVRVRLSAPSHAAVLHLSVDNNDVYDVELLNGQQRVTSLRISPRSNGGGLAVHRLRVPDAARSGGFDGIQVRPVSGDGSFGLGHLLLIEQP